MEDIVDTQQAPEPTQEVTETPPPVKAKPKRERSQKQIEAFEKCRLARVEQIKRIKDAGGTQPAKVKRDDVYKLQQNILEKQEEFMNTVVEAAKKPKAKPKHKAAPRRLVVTEVLESETDPETEPEPVKPKPKRKYNRKLSLPPPPPDVSETEETQTETETETETESEPVAPKKRQYNKRPKAGQLKGPPAQVALIEPVLRQPSIDFR
tara:strand:+ start:1223 stop:1846 length:624 start_codon:yes stop_codon:yes gene_type:complete